MRRQAYVLPGLPGISELTTLRLFLNAAMEDQEISDELLARIATRAGGIKPLLETFFSFLERKTDFYVEFDASDETRRDYKMGFPVGVAEKMVLQAFRKHKLRSYQDLVGEYEASTKTKPQQSASTTPVKGKASAQHTDAVPSTPPRVPSTSGSSVKPPATPVTAGKTLFKASYTPEGKQVPIGNGGIGDKYYWTQTLKDITIYIDTAAGCRSKDIKCVIKPTSLLVEIRGECILDGALEDVVKVGESMWTISSTTDSALQQVVVTLDKTRQTWWKHVVAGHEEIDTTKVDSTQNIGEYDETTQAAIRKIMFEQKQKMLGEAPPAELSETDRLLHRAAQLPGSPI